MKHVAFSGTRYGMPERQRHSIEKLLRTMTGDVTLHHGDCVGADAQVHSMALAYGFAVVLHPPKDDRLRAYCDRWDGATEIRPEEDYLTRNRDMVDTCGLLVAAPWEWVGRGSRGGTWYTIRYAERKGLPVRIVRPTGEIQNGRS